MIKIQLNPKWMAVLATIILGGCTTYELPPKQALTCGAEYPCNGCQGGCPYTSSYKSFFESSSVN